MNCEISEALKRLAAEYEHATTQKERDRKKREYDEQRKAFDERHDALCEYALGHPEVFDPGEGGRSREGSTGRVKYKLTSGGRGATALPRTGGRWVGIGQTWTNPAIPRSAAAVGRAHVIHG